MTSPAALRLLDYLKGHARGRGNAVPQHILSFHLDIPKREVQALVAELVDAGHLIGSSATPGRAGVFTIESFEDLEAGTAWYRARALTTLRRVSVLRKAAEAQFGPQALHLFDDLGEAS